MLEKSSQKQSQGRRFGQYLVNPSSKSPLDGHPSGSHGGEGKRAAGEEELKKSVAKQAY